MSSIIVAGPEPVGLVPGDETSIADIAPESPTAGDNTSLKCLAVIAGLWALQWAQVFLIPVAISLALAYTLSPIVSWLKRWKVPRGVGAALVLSILVSALGLTANSLRHEAARILEELPRAMSSLSRAVISLQHEREGTMNRVREAARELARVTGTQAEGSEAAGAVRVVVEPDRFQFSDLFWAGSLGALGAMAQLMIIIFLVFFLLQGGDSFRRRLVKVAGSTLSEKKITIKILDDISSAIQRYMFMLLVTNSLLALSTWLSFRVVGMDNAGAWGVAAGVLHVVPYFGTVVITLASAAAAFLQFGTFSAAFLVAGVSLVISALIGVFVTTWMTGRLARMNPTAVFVALLFFGWIWGTWGLLLAIPIAVSFKVVAEHIESLQPLGDLLGS